MILFVPMFAAAGYALLYLLLGGGLGGAILIFLLAKMLGKQTGRRKQMVPNAKDARPTLRQQRSSAHKSFGSV